ncbi:hypothetical protein [Croceicoccus mobilis]|uniref:Secreted protein n=1 Tax=Croceicoccus mobilis TaxID=1703339 RepID=A0A916Z627_9SPHN|nr:hypothetical protein [Croceicoccus mobilis]GGD78309.1 hypothetical protein GCM10010990_30180 [Croceicoccus mobilis]
MRWITAITGSAAIAAATGALIACAPISEAQPAAPQPVAPDILDRTDPAPQPDAASCKASGGVLDRRGRAQTAMCVHPYSDAGKACRDNLECEGKCIAPVDHGPDGQIVGQCQADDALFGCYAEVVDGKSVRAICVD